MTTKVKNRWFMALAAMAIHICIGSVYAWSVYVNPIQSTMNWTLTDVTITFSVAIFFLGLSAALMGKFVESKGPRVAATLAAVLFGLGTIGSGLAIYHGVKNTSLPYLWCFRWCRSWYRVHFSCIYAC